MYKLVEIKYTIYHKVMTSIKTAIMLSIIPAAVVLIVILLGAYSVKGDYTEADVQSPSQVHLIVLNFSDLHHQRSSMNDNANYKMKDWIIIKYIPSSSFDQETQALKDQKIYKDGTNKIEA
jgi:hypothetical protein